MHLASSDLVRLLRALRLAGHGLVAEAVELGAQGANEPLEELLLVAQRLEGGPVLRVSTEAQLDLNLLALSCVSVAGDLLHRRGQGGQSLTHLENLSLHVHWGLHLGHVKAAFGGPRSVDESFQVRS